MFAGRGIVLPGFVISAAVIVGAFALGVGAGWFTASIPDMFQAEPSVTPSPSPSSLLDDVDTPSLGPLPAITRTLTQADRDAGIVTTDVPRQGEGTLTTVTGSGTPSADGGDVRWVSVSIEDGLDVNAEAFRTFALSVLNDNRAWGTQGAIQYVPTDGVADYRIILASPYTAAALCPDRHETVEQATDTPTTASPEPTASADASPSATASADDASDYCSQDDVLVVSLYDWTAGTAGFGEDYVGARDYLLLHRMGHMLGRDDVECSGERADAMVNQDDVLPEGCAANPWPYPDASPALVPSTATPTPTPGA